MALLDIARGRGRRMFAVAALTALAGGARAEGATNIAILDFKPNNVSAGDAAVVSDFVRAAFVRSGTYTVVDKANMERILSEQAFQQTGCTSSDCAVKLGKLLNVKKMVVGNYALAGPVRFLTAQLVDVESGRIERTGKVKGFEQGEIDTAADDLARQLTAGAEAAAAEEARRKADAEAAVNAEEARRIEAGRKAQEEAARAAASQEADRLRAERRTEAGKRSAEVDQARVARGRIGVGLNFPGLGVRALLGSRWLVEGYGQYETEAQAYGGRVYWYVLPGRRVYPYLGTGGGYARYSGEGLHANGYLGEGFAGLEYFPWKRLSFQSDLGPTLVGLQEGTVSLNQVRFTVNFGLTVYF
ncbi:MAG: CsgG/HfaB family protein [bacterium]